MIIIIMIAHALFPVVIARLVSSVYVKALSSLYLA